MLRDVNVLPLLGKHLCKNAIAYLKPIIKKEKMHEEVITLSHDDSPFQSKFNDDLIVMYLVDDGKEFRYIQNRNLKYEQTTSEQVEKFGLDNLFNLTQNENLRIQKYKKDVYALFLDGNFEASLILLDILWDTYLTDYIKNSYIVAIPARDILAFCDSNSQEGIEELKQICLRVQKNEDHLLTNTLYLRTDKGWEKYIL